MKNQTRKVLDKSFTALAYSSLAVMFATVCVFLLPIIINGAGAVFFNATVEHEKFLCENLDYALTPSIKDEIALSDKARAPLYSMMHDYEDIAGAKIIDEKFDEKIKSSVEKIDKGCAKILQILALDRRERDESLNDYSSEIWREYSAFLNSTIESSEKVYSAFALEKILAAQSEKISTALRQSIAKIDKIKKLSFTQKSFLRRNLSAVPNELIKRKIEFLEKQNAAYQSFKSGVRELLGAQNQAQRENSKLLRQKYGQPRMDLARDVLESSVLKISVEYVDSQGREYSSSVSSLEFFRGTQVEKMIQYIQKNFDAMLQPHYTFYFGFFTDDPFDSNIFGGIFPMIVGTFYLTFGSMIIAAPLGIIAAIYFSEYAHKGKLVSFLQMCVGTLAGVPSIVFGLFGLAFLINTVKISESKSVLAGAVTLALLILPTIIRSCQEALKAVPNSYREASLALGAGKWRAICSVILPAALPSMLTGIIISMGRAAGETAPIIFTAATSTGAALAISEVFSQPTPALPWNIYNICSEHEMAERVAHVQYGMVLTLIAIVLLLNGVAIFMRARLQKKMKS